MAGSLTLTLRRGVWGLRLILSLVESVVGSLAAHFTQLSTPASPNLNFHPRATRTNSSNLTVRNYFVRFVDTEDSANLHILTPTLYH